MAAHILPLHHRQRKYHCRPSPGLSGRSAAGFWHTFRGIVEAVRWITVIGLILGHIQ